MPIDESSWLMFRGKMRIDEEPGGDGAALFDDEADGVGKVL